MNAALPVVVPVPLGCCPGPVRCLLCGPAPVVLPETVAALVEHYRSERAPAGAALQVRFFGGAPPSPAHVEAVGRHPWTARVRPDLLTRADAARMAATGCAAIELDALTFDAEALRATERPYGPRLLDEQAAGLPRLGLRVGGVLAPGLPGTSFATCVADADRAARAWRFARLHPVLVLAGSRLRDLHARGRYVPLDLTQAVTACCAVLDRLEAAEVEVIRVGLQPGPDGCGRAVAGPRHPALRELVEARRTLDTLRDRLRAGTPPGARVILSCAPIDETRVRGPLNQNLRTLRAEHHLADLAIQTDPELPRGAFRLHVTPVTR